MRKLYFCWLLTAGAVLLFAGSLFLYFTTQPATSKLPPICIAPETIRIFDQQNGLAILTGDRTINLRSNEITYTYFIKEPEQYRDLYFNRKINVN
ncbi:MAG: hypothetical protein ACRC5A_15895, partial [Enterobacteriaceae bacterium]